MKNLLIVANWKESKTLGEAILFLESFLKGYRPRENVTVVICPSYLSVPAAAEFVKKNNLKVEIGVQNISKFPEGAHTGEVSAAEAGELAKYSIIGHSERRSLGETDDDVQKKVELAINNNIQPIICIVGENIPIPAGVKIVAYEPVEAIGTGNPDTPENAERVASAIKSKNNQVRSVLYGGSVTSKNVKNFTQRENIDGVLVGGASLDPIEFSSIIEQC